MLNLLLYIFVYCVVFLQAVTGVFASLSHFSFEVGRGLAATLTIYLFFSLAISLVLLVQGRPFLALIVATVSALLNVFIASKCR